MEYYSPIKKNEIMSSAATWMDLDIVKLNEKARVNTGDITEITVEIRLLKDAGEKRSVLTHELSQLSGVKRVSLLSHNGETVF